MALHWHIGKIENFEELCWVPAEQDSWMPGGHRKGDLILNPVTDGLIHATMAVGMFRITHANWRKFAGRLLLLQAVAGPIIRGGTRCLLLTPDDVRRHIGLATNASTITEPVFLRRILRLAGSGQGDGAVTKPAEWGVTTHAEWMRGLEQHQNGND